MTTARRAATQQFQLLESTLEDHILNGTPIDPAVRELFNKLQINVDYEADPSQEGISLEQAIGEEAASEVTPSPELEPLPAVDLEGINAPTFLESRMALGSASTVGEDGTVLPRNITTDQFENWRDITGTSSQDVVAIRALWPIFMSEGIDPENFLSTVVTRLADPAFRESPESPYFGYTLTSEQARSIQQLTPQKVLLMQPLINREITSVAASMPTNSVSPHDQIEPKNESLLFDKRLPRTRQ